MSYILEALRKSEKKRPPGAAPDLFTVQGPQPADGPRRPLWFLGAAAVVMVFAGVGAWLWLGGRERVPEVTSTEQSPKASASSGGASREAEAYAPVGSVPSAPAASSVPGPAAPTAAASRPAAAPAAGNRRAAGGGTPAPGARVPPVPSPQPPAAITPPESRPGSQSPAVGTAGAQLGSPGEAAAPLAAERELLPAAPPAGAPPAAAVAQPAAGVPRMPAAAPSAPAAPPGTQAPAPSAPGESAPAAVPEKAPAPPAAPAAVPIPAAVDAAPPAPRTQDAAAADAPPADGRIVTVEELPQSVRVALGKFTVSGHVWSEEPALRLLTVENRLVREGQEAAPGVRLEEITPDGAVFTLKGWRFRIAGF